MDLIVLKFRVLIFKRSEVVIITFSVLNFTYIVLIFTYFKKYSKIMGKIYARI